VKVAIGVNCNGGFVHQKCNAGRAGMVERSALGKLPMRDGDPGDMVLLRHRMSGGTYGDNQLAVLPFSYGDMLFLSRIHCVGRKQRHILSAAHYVSARILNHAYGIPADFASKKFPIVFHGYSPFYCGINASL